MNCGHGRRARRRVIVVGRPIPGDVQTAPCPVCRSFHTIAHLVKGDLLFRGCHTCGHVWDDVRHIDVKVRG